MGKMKVKFQPIKHHPELTEMGVSIEDLQITAWELNKQYDNLLNS